jgi:hypothetical protein
VHTTAVCCSPASGPGFHISGTLSCPLIRPDCLLFKAAFLVSYLPTVIYISSGLAVEDHKDCIQLCCSELALAGLRVVHRPAALDMRRVAELGGCDMQIDATFP